MVGTRGKPGDSEETAGKECASKGLSEPELANIQAKLKQRETELNEAQSRLKAKEAQLKDRESSLREEAVFLAEQRKKQDRRGLEIEQLQEAMQRNSETRGQAAALEDMTAFKNDLLTEIEELRRELNHLRREPSPSIRLSGQPLLSLDEFGARNESSFEQPHLPKVSFREATESVPNFDGYNISLGQFTRACRRAKEIVPPSAERNLTKLLVNKLRGRAYYAVEDEPRENVTQLIDLLTSAFGSAKTIDQYKGELSTVYLKPQEHMLDYISRVKDLRSAIMDAERRTTGRVDDETALRINELTARSFCEGLPLQYRLQMDRRLYSVPSEAFAKAKELSKREELDRDRYKTRDRREQESTRDEYSRRSYATTNSRNANYSRGQYSNSAPHNVPARPPATREREERPSYNNRQQTYSRSNSNFQPPPRVNDRAPKWCRYCKNNGHEIEECRKRQFNNNLRKNESGNAAGPAGRSGTPLQGAPSQTTRPINLIEGTSTERQESQP